MAVYEVAMFGDTSVKGVKVQFQMLAETMAKTAQSYGIRSDLEMRVLSNPDVFRPGQRTSAVAVFFGSEGSAATYLDGRFDVTSVTVIPVAQSSADGAVESQIPKAIRHLNCLFLDTNGAL